MHLAIFFALVVIVVLHPLLKETEGRRFLLMVVVAVLVYVILLGGVYILFRGLKGEDLGAPKPIADVEKEIPVTSPEPPVLREGDVLYVITPFSSYNEYGVYGFRANSRVYFISEEGENYIVTNGDYRGVAPKSNFRRQIQMEPSVNAEGLRRSVNNDHEAPKLESILRRSGWSSPTVTDGFSVSGSDGGISWILEVIDGSAQDWHVEMVTDQAISSGRIMESRKGSRF